VSDREPKGDVEATFQSASDTPAPAQLILASGSPRRADLLDRLCLKFQVCPPEIDETPLENEPVIDCVQRLAHLKATARIPTDIPVLGADTVVVLGDAVLGKPESREHALDMLLSLSGRVHTVYTAVCVASSDRAQTILSHSEVTFRHISKQEAQAYWDTGEPRDKAGGYGIQGIGNIFVRKIEGSFSGIMGLPLCESEQLLREFGVDTWQHRTMSP